MNNNRVSNEHSKEDDNNQKPSRQKRFTLAVPKRASLQKTCSSSSSDQVEKMKEIKQLMEKVNTSSKENAPNISKRVRDQPDWLATVSTRKHLYHHCPPQISNETTKSVRQHKVSKQTKSFPQQKSGQFFHPIRRRQRKTTSTRFVGKSTTFHNWAQRGSQSILLSFNPNASSHVSADKEDMQRLLDSLKRLGTVAWELGSDLDQVDIMLNLNACAFIMRTSQFALRKNTLLSRLGSAERSYRFRLLIVLVDQVSSSRHALTQLACLSFEHNLSMLIAWSWFELARYLESFKVFEKKNASVLEAKLSEEFPQRISQVLTTVPTLNKTDVVKLRQSFGSLDQIIQASKSDLILCPGLGVSKVNQLQSVFTADFQ